MHIVVFASYSDGSEMVYGRYQASSVEEVDRFMAELDQRRFWVMDHTHHRYPACGFRYEVEEEVEELPDVSVHLIDLVLFVDTLVGSVHFDSLLPECSGFDHQATVGQVHILQPYHHDYQFHLVLDPSALGYQALYDATFDQFGVIADAAEEHLRQQLDDEEVLSRIHESLEVMRLQHTVEE